MKYLLILLAVGLSALRSAHGAEGGTMRVSKPAVKDEIIAVIEAQLAAFRRGDLEKAYGYASEGMRVQMPVRAFARMVQQNYPEIWQNTRVEFSIVRDDGARATLVVHAFAKDSDAAYDYVLFKESDGWRVGGVLRREPRKGNSV